MTETLTESFCERCGTRYEFSAPTRLNPLRKTRGFIGGLKNYLTSQDAMSDAMSDAMRQQEEALAAAQLEAFHESFNFCIDCRQYTCINCWNDGAGRCRSCAPVAGTDDLAERLAASLEGGGAVAVAEPILAEDELQRRLGVDPWPSSDLPVSGATNGHADVEWPDADVAERVTESEPAVEPEPVAADDEPQPELVPEPIVAAAEDTESAPPHTGEVGYEPVPVDLQPPDEPVAAEAEPVAAEAMLTEPEVEPVVAGAEVPVLRVVGWEDDQPYDVLDEAPPEPEAAEPVAAQAEPVAAQAEPEPEAEPVTTETAAVTEPEPIEAVAEPAEPEPELVEALAQEPEPEAEPLAADADVQVDAEPEAVAAIEPQAEAEHQPRIAPISETILRFPPRETGQPDSTPDRQAAEAESPELAARRAQLDLLGLGDPGEGPVEQRPAVLPYRSRGAAPPPGQLAARRATAGSTFWEASAREVAGAGAHIGVQNCGQCGLSLSANARFCRRCGTRQARSA